MDYDKYKSVAQEIKGYEKEIIELNDEIRELHKKAHICTKKRNTNLDNIERLKNKLVDWCLNEV